jgi:hypothetical protein
MNLGITWHPPISLDDGDAVDLIYSVEDLQEWEGCPAVYMFCRNYGGALVPLYIGRSKNVGQRIRQHLNTTRMMKAIQKSPQGERVLIIGEFIPKPGQSVDTSLKLIEKTLIEHALTEGYELINKSGTKTPVHTISFSGYKIAKDFSGPKMYAKSKS